MTNVHSLWYRKCSKVVVGKLLWAIKIQLNVFQYCKHSSEVTQIKQGSSYVANSVTGFDC